MHFRKNLLPLLLISLVSGCVGIQGPSGPPPGDSGPDRIPAGVLTQPDPTPRDEPLSASGNSMSYVVFGKRYNRLKSARGFDQVGVASWYGKKFHGRLTASGERYDMYSMTAAHKSIPLPTFARVTNLANNRSIVVRINDRGPFVDDRLIDLSYAGAAKLDMLKEGTARVRVVALSGVPGEPSPNTAPRVASPLPYRVPQPILSGPTIDNRPPAAGTTLAQRTPRLSAGRYLQLGAFGNFDAAGELLTRIGNALAVEVFVAKQTDSEFYRVQAGPFESEDLLAAAQQKLLSQYAINAIPLMRAKAGTLCC